MFLNFGTCAIHAFCVTLFRSLASVDRLALQESYLHNVALYFVILCFEHLKTVYISLLQLKYDIEFFYACTVSTFISNTFSPALQAFLNYLFVVTRNSFLVWCLSSSALHWIYINRPALPYLVLHSLLEEFLPPYYYSAASAPLQQFLVHARQFRNSAVKCSPSAIVKTHLQLVHGQDFKLDTSQVHFYVFGLFSLFFPPTVC